MQSFMRKCGAGHGMMARKMLQGKKTKELELISPSSVKLQQNLRLTKRYFSSSVSSTSKASSASEVTPTPEQLKIVALRYAVPMIGFGFTDNLVMITAGEAIDQTFGVTLGISTMTAAGFGQVCSDVAGNLSGGFVDALCAKLNLPKHHLTEAQLDMRITRYYRTAGACVGVVIGCLLGMSCLLFMDTDAADRARRAKELESIFQSVMKEGKTLFQAERASLFMLDEEKKELWSQVATGTKGIIKVDLNQTSLLGESVKSGDIVNVRDAYEDDRFNAAVDKESGFRTKSILVIPVKDENGKIIGAIQMINKKTKDGEDAEFTKDDEKLVTMMASHVTSFIRIVGGD
ncbi:hypothetical protein CTEN210_09736 [Chaetoceros tenuissimus]|uniref:GAF domain-containing protein n=1 Tax=Chaetoceros tenuissimus TaxID=426638 RepID=A0AAD3CYI2_9STRA|nr:hypothetical protein CTEN210_09736 [Chaetoceros tenuissimus]